jgi:phosphoserine phosphatase
VTRVILVRHGESTSNVAGIVQGRGNLHQPELQSTLTEKGHQQAILAGKALGNLPFDAAYVSPLVRTQQTAANIFKSLLTPPAISTHDDLCEIDLTLWEGLDFELVRSQFPEAYQNWQSHPRQFRLGDRYPIVELFDQAHNFLEEILPKHKGETILLVGHSGINRAIIVTALGIGIDSYHRIQQYNCAISVLNFSDRPTENLVNPKLPPAQLESVNIVSHLAPLLGSPLPPLKKEHQGQRILLVRHGETDWNRQKRFQGQIDVPLNPKGEEQAKLTGEFLASINIDLAFSSSMLRPKQTALEILEHHHPGLTLVLVDQLQEISHGRWEGKLESEIELEFPGELQNWQNHPASVQMPEGENLDQVWARVALAWQKILVAVPPGKTAMVVAHDAVNKAILCQLFNLKPDAFWTFKQGNGGVSVIDYPHGYENLPALQAMNITTHISETVLDMTAAGAL